MAPINDNANNFLFQNRMNIGTAWNQSQSVIAVDIRSSLTNYLLVPICEWWHAVRGNWIPFPSLWTWRTSSALWFSVYCILCRIWRMDDKILQWAKIKLYTMNITHHIHSRYVKCRSVDETNYGLYVRMAGYWIPRSHFYCVLRRADLATCHFNFHIWQNVGDSGMLNFV